MPAESIGESAVESIGQSVAAHELLALDWGATVQEIRTAYRKTSKLVHPDRNQKDPAAQIKFSRLTAAKDYLLAEALRGEADAPLGVWKNASGTYEVFYEGDVFRYKEELPDQSTLAGKLCLVDDGWWEAEVRFEDNEEAEDLQGWFRIRLKDPDHASSHVRMSDEDDWSDEVCSTLQTLTTVSDWQLTQSLQATGMSSDGRTYMTTSVVRAVNGALGSSIATTTNGSQYLLKDMNGQFLQLLARTYPAEHWDEQGTIAKCILIHLREWRASLKPGAAPHISGLKARADLNGAQGTCEQWLPDQARWKVKFASGESKALRVDNLYPYKQLCSVTASACAPSEPPVAFSGDQRPTPTTGAAKPSQEASPGTKAPSAAHCAGNAPGKAKGERQYVRTKARIDVLAPGKAAIFLSQLHPAQAAKTLADIGFVKSAAIVCEMEVATAASILSEECSCLTQIISQLCVCHRGHAACVLAEMRGEGAVRAGQFVMGLPQTQVLQLVRAMVEEVGPASVSPYLATMTAPQAAEVIMLLDFQTAARVLQAMRVQAGEHAANVIGFMEGGGSYEARKILVRWELDLDNDL